MKERISSCVDLDDDGGRPSTLVGKLRDSTPAAVVAPTLDDENDNHLLMTASATAAEAAKKSKIEAAIRSNNAAELQRLALEDGGLLEDSLRRRAWPILLGVDVHSIEAAKPRRNNIQFEATSSYEQAARDVIRTIPRFPPWVPRWLRHQLQESLLSLIARVLTAHPHLHYFQGYHDICVTVLLVSDGDEDLAFAIMEYLSRTKLRAFMESTINATTQFLSIVFPLMGACNSQLRKFFEKSACGIVFLLPWCLTWYSHVVKHYPTLTRLFDLFLASDEVMPVYLATAVILPHQETLLRQECSLEAVHVYLNQMLPLVDCTHGDMEKLVSRAKELFRRFSPKSILHLEAENRIQQSGAGRRQPRQQPQQQPARAARSEISSQPVEVNTPPREIATFLLDDYVLVTAFKSEGHGGQHQSQHQPQKLSGQQQQQQQQYDQPQSINSTDASPRDEVLEMTTVC